MFPLYFGSEGDFQMEKMFHPPRTGKVWDFGKVHKLFTPKLTNSSCIFRPDGL